MAENPGVYPGFFVMATGKIDIVSGKDGDLTAAGQGGIRKADLVFGAVYMRKRFGVSFLSYLKKPCYSVDSYMVTAL